MPILPSYRNSAFIVGLFGGLCVTLRKKTLLVIGLTLIGFTLILYVFSQIILTRSFAQLEEQSTRRDVERAMDALNSEDRKSVV